MQILGHIGLEGVLYRYVKYKTFVTFLTAFFSILSTGQTAALAHTFNGSNDVFPRKKVPFGIRVKIHAIFEEICPKSPKT